MRKCTKCNLDKNESEFHNKKKGYQCICKECRKSYIRQHYLNNKDKYKEKAKKASLKAKEWYDNFKSQLECEICGENHIACLDFHHKDRANKKFMIATLRESKVKFLEEIEKCKVLCSNCHRKLHYEEKNGSVS